MLRGDPGTWGPPRSQTRSEPPAAPPYPPLQSRRRLQLHAGTSLRTDPAEGWVWGQELEDQFLCFSPPARTRAGLDRTPLSVEQGLGARRGVAGRQEVTRPSTRKTQL